ncbi:MAG: response regulator [Acidobacteriota bacterium]|nr:response regulator [Acidobacteriota bacterium]
MHSVMQSYGASCMPDVSFVHDVRGPFTAGARVSRVLLAVDDTAALEALALLLADAGVVVEAAPTLEACVRALAHDTFDLLVIDLRLGGETGLACVSDLRARGGDLPFVLVARKAPLPDVVEAMRLGARTVLETGAEPAELVEAILRELAAVRQRLPAVSLASSLASVTGGAPARRWAGYVLAATMAHSDPRTLADWARAIGVSRSVLIESCARLGVTPRDARDLARVLRLVRRIEEPWEPDTALDVADRRTLRALLVRAGLAGSASIRPAPRLFLARQQFVGQTNAGLAALRQLLDG